MKQADQLFSEDNHKQITEAVVAAESKTSAEIVPVVAQISGRYERAEDSVGLWGSLIAVAIVWACSSPPAENVGDWSTGHPVTQLVVYLLSVLIGYILGTCLGGQFDDLKRLFTPAEQMKDEVWRRARAVFFDRRVHHTAGSTGVLVYLSLYEHRAVILADEQVVSQIGQDRLDEMCREMIQIIHEKGFTEAIVATVSALGDELGKSLPRAEDDVNELDDALVIIP